MSEIHYLDTSALVKLLLYPDISEPGSKDLYEFRGRNTGFYTLDLCVGEALNVLKKKAMSKGSKKSISFPDGYLICVDRLMTFIKQGHTLHIIECALSDVAMIDNVKELVIEHNIDFVDALVIIKAKNHKPYTYEQNMLITADKGMQKAAEALKLNVWNCIFKQN